MYRGNKWERNVLRNDERSIIEGALDAALMPEGFEPDEMDIVCGRGCSCSNRPGNKAYMGFVHEYVSHYRNAPSRVDKSTVVAHVLDKTLELGSRFMKKDKATNRWQRMTREEAHGKTGHAIRDVIRLSEKGSQRTAKRIRRSRSAEVENTSHPPVPCVQKRSRSETSIRASFPSPDLILSDCAMQRLSIDSRGNVIEDVLKAVGELYESEHIEHDLRSTFDETPIPNPPPNDKAEAPVSISAPQNQKLDHTITIADRDHCHQEQKNDVLMGTDDWF